jgi:hypothetical protein
MIERLWKLGGGAQQILRSGVPRMCISRAKCPVREVNVVSASEEGISRL